jgi:uncharacterized protein YktA (UPF0223 family)
MKLFNACKTGNYKTVIKILKDPENHSQLCQTYTESHETCIYTVCKNGWVNIAKELLLYDIDYNFSSREGWSPLHVATYCAYLEIVEMLLYKKHIDYNKLDLQKRTAKDIAIEYKSKCKNILNLFESYEKNRERTLNQITIKNYGKTAKKIILAFDKILKHDQDKLNKYCALSNVNSQNIQFNNFIKFIAVMRLLPDAFHAIVINRKFRIKTNYMVD